LLPGCGPSHPPTYAAGGKVQFSDGQPVGWGIVEFYSLEQKVAARGAIQSDGTFRLSTYGTDDGAVAGKHLVSVGQVAPIDRPVHHQHAGAKAVPKRYANPKSSGLELEVNPNTSNQFTLIIEP
jgi:hypothetical protein